MMRDSCFPTDCVFLSTSRGSLVVSPDHGTYCAVLPDEREAMKAWIDDKADALPEPLHTRLKAHGFFDEARPFRPHNRLLQFQVTNACNLRCAYCSADSGCPRQNEITLDDVKRVIDEAATLYPDIQFSFTGGEPLLVPWIFDAIEYAVAHAKAPIGLLSNLLILKNHPSHFQKIVQLLKNKTIQLQVSISGASREVCDRLSGHPCFDDTIDIIQRLHEAGVHPQIDLMLSAPDAQANIDAFADFRRAIPDEISISLGILYPCGREKGEHVFLAEDELESVFDKIAFEGGVSIPAPQISPVTKRRKACQCIEHENMYIRSDGTIFSCFKLVEPFGHISEGLETVMARRKKCAVLAKDLPLCRNCPFVSLCASGCRADNLIYEESVRAPICGKWRKQLIAEMLFEDKPFVFDWPIPHQMAEAKKRGIPTPQFIITEFSHQHAGVKP